MANLIHEMLIVKHRPLFREDLERTEELLVIAHQDRLLFSPIRFFGDVVAAHESAARGSDHDIGPNLVLHQDRKRTRRIGSAGTPALDAKTDFSHSWPFITFRQ